MRVAELLTTCVHPIDEIKIFKEFPDKSFLDLGADIGQIRVPGVNDLQEDYLKLKDYEIEDVRAEHIVVLASDINNKNKEVKHWFLSKSVRSDIFNNATRCLWVEIK